MNRILNISEAASIALHAMVLLSSNGDKQISTREIASTLGVSEAHLAKTLQRLGKTGLVNSIRGPKGGFVLSRPADQISLMEVYQAIDGKIEPARCLIGDPVCDGKNCIMGGILGRVTSQVMDYFNNTKVSEVNKVFRRDGDGDEKDNQD